MTAGANLDRMRRGSLVALALFAFVLIQAACGGAQGPPESVVVEQMPARVEEVPEPALVVVDVQGAVARPGVYQLPEGSRVQDAMAAAGGALPEADPNGLNRAAVLRDGALVYVPVVGEIPPAGALAGAGETLINVNRATAAELTVLPGVGPTTAAKIVRAREQAPFGAIEELQTRGLVTARVFADIRDLITVR